MQLVVQLFVCLHNNTNKNTNIYTTMKYFININLIQDLEKDSKLRHELAVEMEISERAVYNTIKRYLEEPLPNCSFTKLAAVNFFKSKGITEEEIFEAELQPAT